MPGFSREIVRLPVDAFVEFLDELIDEATKHELRKRLVEDHQLPDRSFKALIAGLLSKLGEKVAGQAGEAIVGELLKPFGNKAFENVADRVGAFVACLLRSDVVAASRTLRSIELAA